MSWFNTSTKAKKSNFFAGVNIFTQLNNSIFGKIKNTITELFGNDCSKEYVLPRVIVIGNESAGKSCLLENITKCQIFPRGSSICTKCPIHLKLNNGDEPSYSIIYKNTFTKITDKQKIYGMVKSYLDKIKDGISADEIIINITEPGLPVFEFFDLPGIVSYPPENATQTLELSKQYLRERNTIVLCVVPATITRLTSCQSIALIKEMKMEENSVLALTMADRIQPINISELLINRLLQTSDEIIDLHFSGYVAVVNRTHDDKYSLKENDKHEVAWFHDNIISGIPDSHKKEEDIILQNITINNLVKRLDTLYSNYIEKEWKPIVIDKIKSKLELLDKEYIALGTPVKEIDIKNVITCIHKQIKDAYVLSYKDKNIFIEQYQKNYATNELYTNHSIYARLYAYILELEHSGMDIRCFEENINAIFDTLPPLVLNRFEHLRRTIIHTIHSTICDMWAIIGNCIISNLKYNIDDVFCDSCRAHLRSEIAFTEYMSNMIKLRILDPVINDAYDCAINYIGITEKDFIESAEYVERRTHLSLEIKKVMHHYNKITDM
jgi:GTP-binding protein EngB required for normal cell division